MYGEALAVATALMWAASTILSAEAVKKVDPVRSNAVKTFFSAVLMLPIAFAAGEMGNLSSVSLQGLSFVIAAALIGFGIGDTLLLQSITLVGVSRAYTFAYTYPLVAMIIALVFLGEPFYPSHLVGTVLIVLSVILILSESTENTAGVNHKGLLMAFGTALTWAVGVTLMALGLRDISVLLANALRYPVLSVLLFLISKPNRKWDIERRSLILLLASGGLGMVLGGLAFLHSMSLIGASRATPLSGSSPVWASVMSSIALKEKVSPRLLLSSVIVVVGTCFLIV